MLGLQSIHRNSNTYKWNLIPIGRPWNNPARHNKRGNTPSAQLRKNLAQFRTPDKRFATDKRHLYGTVLANKLQDLLY
jgi:hypothetical protein